MKDPHFFGEQLTSTLQIFLKIQQLKFSLFPYGVSCSPKKGRSFIQFHFFREVLRFWSSQYVQNFFSKKFLLFVIFPFFCFFGHFLEKTTKNGLIFSQIYGTNSEKKNYQKMFIFRSQTVLRPQLRFRNRLLSIA